jgi:hypothetical protein
VVPRIYRQSGFFPVKLSPQQAVTLDLMLVPKDPQFNFADAPWDTIKAQLPFIANEVSDADGKDRYGQEMEDKPEALASLFNLTTAMQQVFLPQGTPLDYLKQIIWDDTFAQDRFFAWCDPALIEQVKLAETHGKFAREVAPWLLHPGSTSSWKQIEFGEANLQLTFHEKDTKKIGNLQCVMVEPDMDYENRVPTLLEVLPAQRPRIVGSGDGVCSAGSRGAGPGFRSSARLTPSCSAHVPKRDRNR